MPHRGPSCPEWMRVLLTDSGGELDSDINAPGQTALLCPENGALLARG